MKSTPALIMRQCALWLNGDLKIGQASEMTIPPFKMKTEKMRNAGMVTERNVRMGYERENATFKSTAFDPQAIGALNGLSDDDTMMITGALVDEDGTVTNATCYMRGFVEGSDFGNWKPGDVAEVDFDFHWTYLKLEVGDQELIEADDFNFAINGVSQTGDINSALLI
jgi:P2 family phage contractile tail tube protein